MEKLKMQPMCEECARHGRNTTAATEVHHITPVDARADAHEKERLMFSMQNLMSVCRECHRAIHAAMGSNRQSVMARRMNDAALLHFSKVFGLD